MYPPAGGGGDGLDFVGKTGPFLAVDRMLLQDFGWDSLEENIDVSLVLGSEISTLRISDKRDGGQAFSHNAVSLVFLGNW